MTPRVYTEQEVNPYHRFSFLNHKSQRVAISPQLAETGSLSNCQENGVGLIPYYVDLMLNTAPLLETKIQFMIKPLIHRSNWLSFVVLELCL